MCCPALQFSDPEFSWKFAIAPAAIGFHHGNALGPQFNGDLFVGLSLPLPLGGPLLQFDLTANRSGVAVTDPRLADLVADNPMKRDLTESESLVIGRDFGIITDIEIGAGRQPVCRVAFKGHDLRDKTPAIKPGGICKNQISYDPAAALQRARRVFLVLSLWSEGNAVVQPPIDI